MSEAAEAPKRDLTDSQRERIVSLGRDFLANYKRLDEIQSQMVGLNAELEKLAQSENEMFRLEGDIERELNDIISVVDDTPENRAAIQEALAPFLLEVASAQSFR